MAIDRSDIRILKSERFTDEPDGGGATTNTVIPTGVVNNLWDDISRPVLARGGVSLRKIFCAIRSANTDKALGGHLILLSDSDAENVSTVLFNTDDHYDERSDAQSAIEQYVVLGGRSALRPVGTQHERQTSITVYASDAADAPEVGSVFILRNEEDDIEQPIKVSDVDVRAASYTYMGPTGEYLKYRAYEITLTITQPLQHTFEGREPSPSAYQPTQIFNTQSNSAANYYGIKPLAKSAAAGDREVTVSSIFSPLVPAATTETALLDQRPGLLTRVVQPCGAAQDFDLGRHNGSVFLTLPQQWVPGSLRVEIDGSEYSDDGNTLQQISGVSRLNDDAVVSSNDGTLQLELNGHYSITGRYLPGAAIELIPYTQSFEISASNRQLTYTGQLKMAPMPGSLRIEFYFQGRWYELSDNGNGALSGPGASGSVNYQTRSYSFTLPGEPDVGSKIITTYAQSPYKELAAGEKDAWLVIDLPQPTVAGSLSMTWSRGSSHYSASVDANNDLSGNATGRIYGRRLYFKTAQLPTSDIVISYDRRQDSGSRTTAVSVAEQFGSDVVIDTGFNNIQADSVRFNLQYSYAVQSNIDGVVTETRFSSTLELRSDAYARVLGSYGVPIGSINAVTGEITISAAALRVNVRDYVESGGVGQFVDVTRDSRIDGQNVDISLYANDDSEAATHTAALSDLDIEIQIADEYLLPGSQRLTLSTMDLVDRGDGYLYRDFNALTAAGVQAGQIDYRGGVAVIPYVANQNKISSLFCTLLSVAGGVGAAAAVKNVVFRTSASPLRSSGLQFSARRSSDTALLRAESDSSGVITGTFDTSDKVDSLPQPGRIGDYLLPIVPVTTGSGSASGDVDAQSGLIEINFSQPVVLSSLTYNAVAFNTVPLDPDVLGLNPVRLPTNGLVPIYKSGYLSVIHNTQTIEITSPVAAQVVDCGRTNLATITVRDAAGVDVDSAQYTADRAAGSVTLADPFLLQDADGNSLQLPLQISHRVEDVVTLGGVDVGGELKLLTELNHDYPADSTYVSSAIEFGVLQSRISDVRDFKTDDRTFDGDGESAAATYDDINHPIVISNAVSVEDRWKIKFTSSTAFQCISERRGIVGTGSTNADFAPINTVTQQPYFTIKSDGWGAGWVSGNVVLFNTVAADDPAWAIRTVLPSNLPAPQDATQFEFRVEAD